MVLGATHYTRGVTSEEQVVEVVLARPVLTRDSRRLCWRRRRRVTEGERI